MQKQITYNGINIFYKVIGSGEPVVLIHGFSEDSEVWKYQIDFLKDKFKLIVPDIPGSGQSAIGNGQWTTDKFSDCIKAILDEEFSSSSPVGGGRVGAIIGHSMGGYVTLAFAEKYPHLLNKFGLFHSTAFADSEEKKQNRRKGIEFIKEHGAFAFLKPSIPNLFASKFHKEHPEEINALIEKGKSFTDEALIQYYEAMIARPDRVSVLKNFNNPILFIIGTEDKAVPLQDSLQQCHLPSISHIHILEEVAHMGMWEEKEKCNRALLDFLTV
jgi:pimeloyl-ACP methyl ester carboxylesterase